MSIFKSILNTIPRPLLIKASYVVRPLIALYLKILKFTDPIDGKYFRKCLNTESKAEAEKLLFEWKNSLITGDDAVVVDHMLCWSE